MNSEDWLNEMIWCGFSDYMTRRAIVWRFTKYGLIPFLKSHGYSLEVDAKEMSSGIATILFHNWGHTLLTPIAVSREDDYSVEHKQHYNHVIDPARWEEFWKAWWFWEDVSPASDRGFYRRLDIQEYCWSQLDLNNSAQTRIVEANIEGVDESYGAYAGREEYDEY